MKTCSKCGIEKKLSEFYPGRNVCRICYLNYAQIQSKKYYHTNKQEIIQRHKDWHKADPTIERARGKKKLRKGKEYFLKNWLWAEPIRKNIDCFGYIILTFKYGYMIHEHRFLMMKNEGRILERWEHIHHKDGNKQNNNLDNLEIVSNVIHSTITSLITENRELKNRVFALEEEVRNLKIRYKLQEVHQNG